MRRGEIIRSVAGGLALLTGASASARAAGYSEFLDAVEFRGFRAEASYTTDSNVNRAPAGDALRDRILGVRVRAGGVIPLSARTRAVEEGIADAVTVGPDDAYNNPALFAYRFKASIWITTLGYNHAFSGGHSLDFSWRWAHLTPLELRGLATASESSYTANQFSAAYLARF